MMSAIITGVTRTLSVTDITDITDIEDTAGIMDVEETTDIMDITDTADITVEISAHRDRVRVLTVVDAWLRSVPTIVVVRKVLPRAAPTKIFRVAVMRRRRQRSVVGVY